MCHQTAAGLRAATVVLLQYGVNTADSVSFCGIVGVRQTHDNVHLSGVGFECDAIIVIRISKAFQCTEWHMMKPYRVSQRRKCKGI